MQVSIHDYCLNWKDRFETERSALERSLHGHSIQIDHIGSTSVPGLASKDIIDILIQFESFPSAPPDLSKLGFRRKDAFELEEFLYYTRGDHLHGVHLHLSKRGGLMARVHLEFRDILRSSPSIREEYAQTKRELAALFANDRASYRREKRTFIQRILLEKSELDPKAIERSQSSR